MLNGPACERMFTWDVRLTNSTGSQGRVELAAVNSVPTKGATVQGHTGGSHANRRSLAPDRLPALALEARTGRHVQPRRWRDVHLQPNPDAAPRLHARRRADALPTRHR